MSSLLNTLKVIAKNRYGQMAIAFAVGALIATFLLPTKVTIHTETEVVYKDKIVEKEVEKVVYRDKEVIVEKEVQVRKVWTKTTHPDGTIIETEIYEENSQQIDRIRQLEEEKYNKKLAEVMVEYQEKESYTKVTLNPKKFVIYGGLGTQVDDLDNYFYMAGVYAQVLGPVGVGLAVTTDKDAVITLGVSF